MSKRLLFDDKLDYTEPIQPSFANVVSQINTTGVVHIWIVDKTKLKENIGDHSGLLSKDELKRAERFHFEKDSSTFMIARAVLRLLLASYIQNEPHKIVFDYGKYGKPGLMGDHTIKFNISHSNELIALTFSRNIEIGVDVEYLNETLNPLEVAKTVYSPSEIDFLRSLAVHERLKGFYHLWTRKEALIKFLGYGLSMPIALTSISVLDETVNLPKNPYTVKDHSGVDCYLQSFGPKEGYRAAIASPQPLKSIQLMKWSSHKWQP